MSDENTSDLDPPGEPMFERPKTDFDDGLRDPRDLVLVALVIAVLAILCSLGSLLVAVTT